MGSIFVAFITSPLTLSFPDMNNLCAFAFPVTSFPKSSSERMRVTKHILGQHVVLYIVLRNTPSHVADSSPSVVLPSGPVPLPTVPDSFKSTYQLLVSPALFLSVNAKIAFPFLIASFRSVSSALRALLMRSNASEEGNASKLRITLVQVIAYAQSSIPFLRDMSKECY